MHIRLIITTEKAENMDHLFVLIPLLLGILGSGKATPLDDYVNKPDPTYKYTILSKHKGVGYTLYTINMTSQTWKPSKYHMNYFLYILFYYIPFKSLKRIATVFSHWFSTLTLSLGPTSPGLPQSGKVSGN